MSSSLLCISCSSQPSVVPYHNLVPHCVIVQLSDKEQLHTNVCTCLQSGFHGSQVFGVVPVPPLPEPNFSPAKRQLQAFQAEATSILEEANITSELSAPLAVAAAEAENLTLRPLGKVGTCACSPKPLLASTCYAFA